jgi:cytoskeleton protein RodZ
VTLQVESFGTYLKGEREARKISLDEISRATKIRRAILEAIEKDQGEVLLPKVVVKGFIEAYVRYVGLDPKEVLSKYAEWQKGNEAVKGEESLLDGQRLIPPKYFFAGALCLIIIIIIPLLFFFARGPQEGVKEAALARPPTAYENMVSSEELQPPPSPPSVEDTMPVQSSPPVGVEEAQEIEAEQKVQEVRAVEGEEPSLVREHTLVITASERTWIQVQEGSSLPLDVILYPGDSFTRKSSQQLAVVIGNAAGVTVTFDGTVLASLGEVGQVVRLTLPSPEGG